GGIEEGEEPITAAVRELREETGVVSAEIIAEVPKWLTYDFPPAVKAKVNRLWGGGEWHGQAQKWFLMKLTKDESEINLASGEVDPEFSEWKWANPQDVIEQAVDYKRPTYEEVIKAFKPHLDDGGKAAAKCRLKQAPRAWFQRFVGYALRVGFSFSRCDSSLFIYRQEEICHEILESPHMANCNLTRTLVDTESKLGCDGDNVSDPTLYRSLAVGRSGTLVKEGSACNHDLRTWACLSDFEALDAFCNTFHIPEEVHTVLPNQDDTMHERHAGKIWLYTRFFDFANFRLPLSTFFVDILRHYQINISQLSVIGAAKNNRFFWVDDFACPASFPWHTAKHVTRDHALMAVDFNAQDYATLVAHPSPFQKFPEAFLCLFGLSHHYTLDEDNYPRFVHKNGEGGCLLLCLCYAFYGFVVLLLTIRLFCTYMDLFAFIHAPDPTKEELLRENESELECVERLFDEGGSGTQTEQEDSTRGDASHPPKNPKEDHETSSGTSVTAYVSITPEREDKDHTNSMAEPNLCTIGAPQRFAISSNSFHHSGPTIAEAEVDSLVRSSTPVMMTAITVTSVVDSTLVAKERTDKPYLFAADSSSAGGAGPNTGVFSDLSSSDFLVGGIRTVIDPDSDLQKFYFFASIRIMEHDKLFTEFNVGAARQISLSAEVRMHAEYNVKERRRLQSVVEKQDELLKAKDGEIENLKAQLLLKKAEAAEPICLRAQTSNLEAVENFGMR
nr:NUDIX hydrolase 25 [Tanacetum cinerariifolium]